MGSLVKAQIKNLDTNDITMVTFNPKEYTFEKTAPWKEHNIQGLDAPAFEWTSGAPMQLSVELFAPRGVDSQQREGAAHRARGAHVRVAGRVQERGEDGAGDTAVVDDQDPPAHGALPARNSRATSVRRCRSNDPFWR